MRPTLPITWSGLALVAGLLLPDNRMYGQDGFPCGADQARQQALALDPDILQREADLEAAYDDLLLNAASYRDADTLVYVVPVVFHIIHDEGPENITNEQVLDQLQILNRDYRKLNADTSAICCGFQAADVRVEFRLAGIDPEGNCTNGIHRVRSVETYIGDNGSKLFPWFRYRYVNVWVVKDMENGVAGYAYYPSAVEGALALADGIIIRHDYIGSIGTSNLGRSRALTHEVGHFLNLKHPWGDSNSPGVVCGDDDVPDTPITKGWSFCPSPANSAVCDPDTLENFQNYMDYSYCSNMFSAGQALRMRLTLNTSLADRNNLWQPVNLDLAGVSEDGWQPCAPEAAFYAEDRFVCEGEPVQFRDNSINGTVTTWWWTFQDGTPANSSDPAPTVVFSGNGWKEVTLTVANDQGSDTRTETFAIRIAPGWSEVPGLLNESFEDPGTLGNWVVQNPEENPSVFAHYSGTGHTGGSSMRLNGFDQFGPHDLLIDDGANDIDELVTPAMDLGNVTGAQLTFWYAYATRSSSLGTATEKLEVYQSTNCGRNWVLRQTIDGSDLFINGITATPYVPTGPGDWRQATVNVSSGQDDMRFKFRFVSSAGANDLFIDDVQVTGIVGITEAADRPVFELFPNPASDRVTLNFALPDAGRAMLEVSDATGRIILARGLEGLRTGTLDLELPRRELGAGMYLVSLSQEDGSRTVRRLVLR